MIMSKNYWLGFLVGNLVCMSTMAFTNQRWQSVIGSTFMGFMFSMIAILTEGNESPPNGGGY